MLITILTLLTLFEIDEPNPSVNQNTEYQKSYFQIDSIKAEFEHLKKIIFINLDSCNSTAYRIHQASDSWDIESLQTKGQSYYNEAYTAFIKIQNPIFNLNPTQTRRLSKALQYYERGFDQIGKLDGPYLEERIQIHENLKNWPQSAMASDFMEVNLDSREGKKISLTGQNKWCLWEIDNDSYIIFEGILKGQGYGRYELNKSDLPVMIEYSKNFSIQNISFYPTKLIFKKCEIKK